METKEKIKVLHYIKAKGKNKRIDIVLYDHDKKAKSFRVITKTLISFKDRHISETDNSYSVETFAVLSNLFTYFLNNSEVKNKILLKELSNITKFNATGTV